MFEEILRIKPVLEPSGAARMEATLTQRFARVTRRFGQGLKAVVTGTALGIGLNILNRILNPINELEDKMNALLGKGKSLADQADRFGTTGGKLQRANLVAERLGVDPGELQKLMEKYAEAIETGREEIKKPLKDQSDATKILSKDFLSDKDLLESFFKFIQSLKGASPEQRSKIEKEVLGEELFGFKKRFANSDFKKEFQSLPTDITLNNAVGNIANAEEQVRINRVNREAQDFLQNSSVVNGGTVSAISKLEGRRVDQSNSELAKFNDFANAARGIEATGQALLKPLDLLTTGISKIVIFIEAFSKTRFFRNITGSK